MSHRSGEPDVRLLGQVKDEMNTVVLLEKLNKIELALDVEERATIRALLREAQQCALELQRETPEQMRRDSRANSNL